MKEKCTCIEGQKAFKKVIMVFKLLELFLCEHGSSSSKKRNPTVIEELCHHFSLNDMRKSTNFDKSQLIGRDYFGDVYKGCLKHNFAASDRKVAVKKMKIKNESPPYDLEVFYKNEIEMLCQLNHPNLISLIGFCDHKNEKIIVYEYMSNGSLHEHIYDTVIEPLSWKKRLEICIGIARGLHYLHSGQKSSIIHRNVNLSNILLDSNLVPKLSDFGFSLKGPRFKSKPKPVQGMIAGTRGYIARECMEYTFSDKSDVYAFGVTLLEVVCAKKLYKILNGTPIEEKIDPVLEGKIAPECWEIYVSITKRCIKLYPNERPTMGELEVELEQVLRMQEQEDIRNNNDNHTLLTNTIIDLIPAESEPEEEGYDTKCKDIEDK